MSICYLKSATCCGSHPALVDYVIVFFNVMIDVVMVIESSGGKWEVKLLQWLNVAEKYSGDLHMLNEDDVCGLCMFFNMYIIIFFFICILLAKKYLISNKLWNELMGVWHNWCHYDVCGLWSHCVIVLYHLMVISMFQFDYILGKCFFLVVSSLYYIFLTIFLFGERCLSKGEWSAWLWRNDVLNFLSCYFELICCQWHLVHEVLSDSDLETNEWVFIIKSQFDLDDSCDQFTLNSGWVLNNKAQSRRNGL